MFANTRDIWYAMANTFAELAQKHAPAINQFIEEFEERSDDAIQAFGAQMRTYLLDNDLAYYEGLHHDNVCVDIDNREGEMLIAIKVRKLLAIIARKGWNVEETRMALLRELPRDPERLSLYLRKNKELIDRSDNLLAPIQTELLRGATGAGSHTTAVLKLVAACKKGRFPICEGIDDHLGHEGFLAQHLILQQCPSLEEPMNVGIRYFVVRSQIADKCPALMRILSEADNAKHSNYQKESALQTMMNIHRRAVSTSAKTESEFNAIARAVSRGHGPEFTKAAKSYTNLARRYGGGENKDLLSRLQDFQATLKVERQIAPDTYEDISKVEFVQGAQYIVAFVKATMACPEQYIKNDNAVVFNTADLSSICGGLKEKCLIAVRIMNEALDFATKIGIGNTAAWARIEGNLDIHLVMHIHNEKADNRKSFKDIRAIAHQCYTDLVQEIGVRASNVESPWPQIDLATEAAETNQGLRALSIRGEVTAEVLTGMGYKEGGSVTLDESEKQIYILTAVDSSASIAKLTHADDSTKLVDVTFAAVLD